jgi:superfamily II DNA or RNA helicase
MQGINESFKSSTLYKSAYPVANSNTNHRKRFGAQKSYPKRATAGAATAVIPPPYQLPEKDKMTICSQSYIGRKGYTISKSALSKEEEQFIRKDLTVKPEMNTAFIIGSAPESSFPVYRESSQKMYLPRFYGIERYGYPTTEYEPCRIQEGDDIHGVEFTKPLREYQTNIVNKYVNYVREKPRAAGGAILQVYTGAGKTVMALKIIAMLKKKTIILVHKEFLMNQWIERIAEFLPNAAVGKIQGPIIDIDKKDIVIGMIQSIYDREHGEEVFGSFGLTIIDEVHRVGSEQFSKTLLKVVTPYMLGISATVERKDKLTKILYMFIGERIHNEERTKDDIVSVRAIRYVSDAKSFNETEYDMRGNPQYSKMIVKLCDFHPRTEFILRVIQDLYHENPDKQMMILGHNRSILTYIHDAIEHRGFATVAYYLGGMKQEDLQESETKQIVVATFAMAAEALDIKTLSTLVMVTPRTDVVQSVGRILRMKHENPIVVDFVDSHDLFQNQWRQRMQYYKKCNYRIRQITSSQYRGMSINWNTDKTWKRVYEPVIKSANTELPNSVYNQLVGKQNKTAFDVNRFFGMKSVGAAASAEEEGEPETGGKCFIDVSCFDDDEKEYINEPNESEPV